MKQIITGLFLTVSLFVNAQMVNITYVTVPRENSETFLELHEKFMNLSNSKERTITQSVIFAHAFAGIILLLFMILITICKILLMMPLLQMKR